MILKIGVCHECAASRQVALANLPLAFLSEVSPPAVNPYEVLKLVNAMQTNAAASLASAIITASGRPHSVEEALNVLRDVHFSFVKAGAIIPH
jgi:hypothetical protein